MKFLNDRVPSCNILETRNLPVLGRWFDFQPLVPLSLFHFGVEGHPNRAVSNSFRRRRSPRPFMGRSGCVFLISTSKVTKTTSGPVGLCLFHFGVEKLPRPLRAGRAVSNSFRRRRSPRPFMGWSGCAYLIPASNVTKTTFGPVGLCLSHSGVEGSSKTFLGRWGCVYLIPASKATKTTSGPVGLCLFHSGVEKLPRPLRGLSGRI
jgi:hypothetical protein